ncbi:hypothetical protein PTTG_11896, partial [Puccinia triticina 1-1 BBBD Race 1]
MRLTTSGHLRLYYLASQCLILQAALFDSTKHDPVPNVEEIGQAFQSPQMTISSRSDGTRSSQVQSNGPKITNQDGSLADVDRNLPHSPGEARRSRPGPGGRSKLLEKWPDRVQKFKSYFKRVKSEYRSLIRSAKDFLNLFERYKDVAIFSEIDHLKEIIGEAHDYYKLLGTTKQKEFWNLFEKEGKSERGALFPRLAKTSTFGRKGKDDLAQAILDNEPKVRTSRAMAAFALETLASIEKGKAKYDEALASSTKLVEDFVRTFANNRKVSDVSQRIRHWKSKHPSEIPSSLQHPYQVVFADLFGPGDIAKPEKDDSEGFRRFQKLWQVTNKQILAIWEVSTQAKKMLADLYTAEEINAQRGSSLWRFLRPAAKYKQEIEQSHKLQREIHDKLSDVFENPKELKKKMADIAAAKTTDEEWADKCFNNVHYHLLPFIDPLRACRRHEDYPDITPLLNDFGISSSIRAMKRLMELSEALVPHLRVLYKQQMIARDFRTELEARLNGASQYRLWNHLKKIVEIDKSSTPKRQSLHRFLL